MAIRLLFALCVIHGASAFYLPGLAPVNFCKAGEETTTCKVRTTRNRSLCRSVRRKIYSNFFESLAVRARLVCVQ